MGIPAVRFLMSATLVALAPFRSAAQASAAPACQQAPQAPTGLSAPARTPTSLILRWNPVPASSGCRVTYTVYDNGVAVATELTAPVTTLRGLAPGSVHLVLVKARNQAGWMVLTGVSLTCPSVAARLDMTVPFSEVA